MNHEERRENKEGGRDRGSQDCCCPPEDKPGPDGRSRKEYAGPRTTEEYLVREWQVSYERACDELRVEILKEKLRKKWGKSIEKIAEEVDSLMWKDWKLSQQKGDHHEERKALVKELSKKILEIYAKGPR